MSEDIKNGKITEINNVFLFHSKIYCVNQKYISKRKKNLKFHTKKYLYLPKKVRNSINDTAFIALSSNPIKIINQNENINKGVIDNIFFDEYKKFLYKSIFPFSESIINMIFGIILDDILNNNQDKDDFYIVNNIWNLLTNQTIKLMRSSIWNELALFMLDKYGKLYGNNGIDKIKFTVFINQYNLDYLSIDNIENNFEWCLLNEYISGGKKEINFIECKNILMEKIDYFSIISVFL